MQAILDAIDERTRLVSLSHVLFKRWHILPRRDCRPQISPA
ncbi:MAG: hypothetical protein U0703_24475 [Anaerolineae bacterium]